MAKKMLPVDAATLPPLPESSKKSQKFTLQVEIPVEYWEEVKKEIDHRGLFIKDAVIYGLDCFMSASKSKK